MGELRELCATALLGLALAISFFVNWNGVSQLTMVKSNPDTAETETLFTMSRDSVGRIYRCCFRHRTLMPPAVEIIRNTLI